MTMLLLSQIIHTVLLGFAIYCAFGAVAYVIDFIVLKLKGEI